MYKNKIGLKIGYGDMNKIKRFLLNLILSILTIVLLASCTGPANTTQTLDSIDTDRKINGYKINQSRDGGKEIYRTEDNKLILVSDSNEKVIYENYRDITANPYSIWSYDGYKVQWSQNDKYIYIIDSVYDLKNDKLIPIKDCVIFSWIDNKGVYLAEGTYYEISYDGGLQNEMAAGKKIKVIDGGRIEEKGSQTGDRYFVFEHYIDIDRPFEYIEDYITISTALLKYKEDELQDKIREELHSDKFRGFLKQNYNKDVYLKYMKLIDVIKESKEFRELQYQIDGLEKSYPIEFEGQAKEIMKIIDNPTHFIYNVSGEYFLQDIKKEEVKFR
ncbi:MAG TPA: hypothetical protein PLL98_07500 [Bacillota bacterium]|nr:hypothetical protein [Bacillota bacterium]